MSDLQKYVIKRKKRDLVFAENFETGYADFKIGVLLRQAREGAGMTQEEVAAKLGTQKSVISRIENHADSAVNIKAADIFEDRPELSVIHIELPNEDDIALPGQRTMDAANTMVKHAVDRENERLTFSYDYGDGWEIKLILEEIIEDKALPGKELPRVLDGAGYGIIEDCGGTGGLTELAKAFKTKKGPRYKELSKWLGTDTLELDSFDMDDMNFRLKKVPRIYKDIYEYDLAPTKQSIDLLERKYKQSK